MSFLGPEGVADRMAQLQSRMDALAPSRPATSGGFGGALNAAVASAPVDLSTCEISPVKGLIGGGSDLHAMADEAAARYDLDPALFRALVDQESGWNPSATSSKGAQGLCQLLPGTAREMGVTNAFDPAQNLDGGAHYLRRMLDVSGGDSARALAAYNAGFGRVNGRAMGEWPAETRAYVTRILARAAGGSV